ncbi:hypothetical protein IG631_11866 [Alternaria alternata]|nr:hypothetical protein IG631_11866 [Alternaria alternata]
MLKGAQTAAGASDRAIDLHAKQRRRRLRDCNIPRWHGSTPISPPLRGKHCPRFNYMPLGYPYQESRAECWMDVTNLHLPRTDASSFHFQSLVTGTR